MAETKNELTKKLDRALDSELVLRNKLQALKQELRAALNSDDLPQCLKGLVAAHEQGKDSVIDSST